MLTRRIHRFVPLALVLLLALGLAGCGGAPSTDDVRTILQTTLNDFAPGTFEVVSVAKRDGVAYEDKGVQGYRMDYTASVRAKKDASLGAAFNAPGLADKLGVSGEMDLLKALLTAKAGERMDIRGQMNLVKYENGWRRK